MRGRGVGDGCRSLRDGDGRVGAVLCKRRYAGPDGAERVDGKIVRIHQEDGAQALGLGPEQKYAAERAPQKSDPTFQGLASLLATYALDPHGQMLVLLRQLTVNLVLGNTDAHAKNYSLLHDATGAVSLSPLYDVVPAREITPQVLTLGMRVHGRIRFDRVARQQVVGEAMSWGLSARAVERELDEALEAASALYPAAGSRHAAAALARLAELRESC